MGWAERRKEGGVDQAGGKGEVGEVMTGVRRPVRQVCLGHGDNSVVAQQGVGCVCWLFCRGTQLCRLAARTSALPSRW